MNRREDDTTDYYQIFDDLWSACRKEEAIKIYHYLQRPFWLADKVGLFYEHTWRPDLAMYEYEHLISASLEMGSDFLPIPGGPIELFKLAKWFLKTDPIKAERYLRLYVEADDTWKEEIRKTVFRVEAKLLLEELMENKRIGIVQRLKELESSTHVTPLHKERAIPDAISLALRSDRIGLWWYQPLSGELFFSVSAGHHLKLADFVGIKDVRGGARGGVFHKDGLNYLLIFKCDLQLEVLAGRVLLDIFQKVEEMSGVQITGGVVDEAGFDLLGNMKVTA